MTVFMGSGFGSSSRPGMARGCIGRLFEKPGLRAWQAEVFAQGPAFAQLSFPRKRRGRSVVGNLVWNRDFSSPHRYPICSNGEFAIDSFGPGTSVIAEIARHPSRRCLVWRGSCFRGRPGASPSHQ